MALELDSFRGMTSSGVVGDDCVKELDMDRSCNWATVVDFILLFRSLVFRGGSWSVGNIHGLC